MAASKVSICNAALDRIGAPPIAALDEDTKRARTMAVVYDLVLDLVLAEAAWPFALKRASLARSADAPAYGYAYAYQLPTDFISLESMADGPGLDYQIEGNQIVTDAESVRLRYVRRVADPNLFPPSFVDLLALRLAAEIALTITRKSSDFETLMALYKQRLGEVRDIVSADQGAPQEETPYWTEGRG